MAANKLSFIARDGSDRSFVTFYKTCFELILINSINVEATGVETLLIYLSLASVDGETCYSHIIFVNLGLVLQSHFIQAIYHLIVVKFLDDGFILKKCDF